MELSPIQLKKIQNYFAKQKDVVAVYLYGSFAKGTTHKRSDMDFGVLFNPTIKTYDRLGKIINDLSDIGLSAEIDARNLNLDDSPVFLMNVLQGQLIYSRDEAFRIIFETSAMNEFYDTQRLRDISYFYMKKRLEEGSYGY